MKTVLSLICILTSASNISCALPPESLAYKIYAPYEKAYQQALKAEQTIDRALEVATEATRTLDKAAEHIKTCTSQHKHEKDLAVLKNMFAAKIAEFERSVGLDHTKNIKSLTKKIASLKEQKQAAHKRLAVVHAAFRAARRVALHLSHFEAELPA